MDCGQYYCASELRRAAVRARAGWNGIDYVEVDPNSDIFVPITLRVVFLKADGLAALSGANFRIAGGVRYRDPPVESAVQTLPGSMTVRVALPAPQLTDYSTYTLQLVAPGSDSPPAGFDGQLSQVSFSFKIDCPAPFDCAPVTPGLSVPLQAEPDLDYSARDWASLRRVMLDRLAALLPDFRDGTPVDFLVTQVEALAYAADHLSYKLDAIAGEKTLWTARSRISLARHARLLDYAVHEGCNARCYVCIRYGGAAVAQLPQGTPLLPAVANLPVTVSADTFAQLLPSNPVVFETMHALTLEPGNNALDFHTWSDTLCTLPRGATSATLRLRRASADPAAHLLPGDFLLLAQTVSPQSGMVDGTLRALRHVVRTTSVTPVSDPVEAEDLLQVSWSADDALPFDLIISADVPRPGNMSVRTVCAQAFGNVVLADHGASLPPRDAAPGTVQGFRPGLDPARPPGAKRWRPQLSLPGLVRAAALNLSLAPAPATSARAAMLNDPVTAIPQLTLADSFSVWTCRPSLLASERFDRHVVVETEHDGTVSLRFGDNIMGLAPDPQDSFTVSGRFGMPLDGNIGADVLRHAVTKVPGIESLGNPLPAQGGIAPLSPTQIRIEAPQAFRTQQRAVTEADWAEMAERQPEVAKAVARVRWTGAWRTAFVYVDRKGGLPVESDADFCKRMLNHLEHYRLAGVDLALRGSLPVALDIMLRLCVRPGVLRSAVWQAVLERLGTGMLPDARRGLFHPDNFTFGAPLYLSTLVAAVMEVPGVASVEPLRFQRWAKAAVNELAQGVIHAGETEVLRLDNDPNFPENGRLAIELLGGA